MVTLQCPADMAVLAYVVFVPYLEVYGWVYEQLAALAGLLQQAYSRVIKVAYSVDHRIEGTLFPRAECGSGNSRQVPQKRRS